MDPSELRSHLETLAHRDQGEADDLIRQLSVASWPSGSVDHTNPIAREWLRRWRPSASHALTLACGCTFGRCTVCN